MDDQIFRHIVLAIHCTKTDKWGAIGISRKKTLAYKPLEFDSFGSLLLDYKKAYESCWHELLKIYVGLPFSHDPYSGTRLHWRVVRFRVDHHPWSRISDALNEYGENCASLMKRYFRSSSSPRKGDVFAKFRLDENDVDSEDESSSTMMKDNEDTKVMSSSVPKLPPVSVNAREEESTKEEEEEESKNNTLFVHVDDKTSRNNHNEEDRSIMDVPPTPAVGAKTIGKSFLGV